jgi:hypothetical protein
MTINALAQATTVTAIAMRTSGLSTRVDALGAVVTLLRLRGTADARLAEIGHGIFATKIGGTGPISRSLHPAMRSTS